MSASKPPSHDAPDFSRVTGEVRGAAELSSQIPAAPVRTYVVRSGDTLSTIAEQVYGKAGRWTEIFAANRDVLEDPDCIQPGQVLQLPAD